MGYLYPIVHDKKYPHFQRNYAKKKWIKEQRGPQRPQSIARAGRVKDGYTPQVAKKDIKSKKKKGRAGKRQKYKNSIHGNSGQKGRMIKEAHIVRKELFSLYWEYMNDRCEYNMQWIEKQRDEHNEWIIYKKLDIKPFVYSYKQGLKNGNCNGNCNHI